MRFSDINIWYPVFEGEEAAAAAAATAPTEAEVIETSDGDDAASEAAIATAKFNSDQQKELNRILAAEKKKHQRIVQKAVDEANALRSKAQLTNQQSQELDARLDQIQNEMRTKEEQARLAAEKAQKQYRQSMESLEAEKNTWQQRFTESTIERSLTDAAAANNAFSPRQIVAILGRNTQLVEVLDEEGKPTGQLSPKVRYATKDKDGKPVTLDLTPSDAIKRMKEEEEYLNLFRGEGSGGAGLRSQPGGKKPDVRNLARDPAAFRRARKAGDINFQ